MPSGAKKNLVLVGGGHAQVYVLDRFTKQPMPNVALTLIARDVLTPYSGMLPGFIAGHYTVEQCHIDLAPLAARAGARLVHDEAVGLDRAAPARAVPRRARPFPTTSSRIDIGSTPNLKRVPGAEPLRHAGQARIDAARALGRDPRARASASQGPCAS